MLGLCSLLFYYFYVRLEKFGVKRMTTSRRIRAAVNENDEYLCNTYLLESMV